VERAVFGDSAIKRKMKNGENGESIESWTGISHKVACGRGLASVYVSKSTFLSSLAGAKFPTVLYRLKCTLIQDVTAVATST
jgi:hypothetical protein